MPKATPRKPSGAVEGFSLSSGTKKCGAGVLIIAVIIGLSHYFSPSEEAETSTVGKTSGTTASAVTALDDTSFDKFVAAHPDGVLVDFYTKSCKFCVKLAPEFEKAAQELKKEGPLLASVDSEVAPNMIQKFGIQRFPTVLWIWKGQNVMELARASEKKASKIVEWASWARGPAVQELETSAEFDEALPTLRATLHAKARLMVAFNRAESPGMREAFEEAAQRHRLTTVFLFIKDASSPGPALKSYAPEESKDEDYQGTVSGEEVTQWVKASLDKAKPAAEAEKAQVPDSKPAATKAMEQVQAALQNAERAKESEGDAESQE